ncbi:MAG: HlyD family efflux transporter periplasmic adaptor subunit [Planctomycetes bacterium]|nr:HlyD family efflux transporter periplasmic adaptor subunit [Planctomycetota bacterium]
MLSTIVKAVVGVVVVAAILGVGFATRETWKGWLIPAKAKAEEKKGEETEKRERVVLSDQAMKNLRLVTRPIALTTYQRKIFLPGAVVDKPGHSDRGIPAPISGVVTNVTAVPGKTVHSGDELFRIRVVSESFQTSQMELYKSTRELVIVQKERTRLEAAPAGAIAATKLLELEYQHDRLKVLIHAYRQDLKTRQLTEPQVKAVENGEFVTEVVILMPTRLGKHQHHGGDTLPVPPTVEGDANRLPVPTVVPVEYEVQELKVNLGDHVQAGQMLAYVADHRFLYIEGRALKQESKLLAQAAQKGWPVEAEFTEDEDDAPGERLANLRIEFLGNIMDPSGLTLPVYVPFANPHRDYERSGSYRPGQKVLLKVTVGTLAEVFVLPQAAVVREGAEAYVFRQNGNAFDRRPVHVIHEDTDSVVIEDDGSILPGNYIAHNAAASLNRILKASQAEGGGGHGHSHSHD